MARASFSFIAEPSELSAVIKRPWYEIENRLQIVSDKFNDGVADGWSSSGGTWSASGGYAHSASSGSVFIYAGATSNTDYVYEAEVSLVYGSEAGIIFRRTGNNSYLQMMIRSGGSVFLETNTGSEIAGAAQSVAYGSNYFLKVDCSGSSITGYVDGAEKISCTVGSLYPSGNIGVKLYAGSANFDNIDCHRLIETLTPDVHALESLRVSETSNDKVPKLTMSLSNKDNSRLSDYNLNQELKCRLGYSGETLGSVFGGVINEVSPDFSMQGNTFSVDAMGYAYDLTKKVDVVTYDDKSGGEIIRDLLVKNYPNIDTGSIAYSGVGLPNYRVVYVPVFDTIKDIANNYDDGVFFVDFNKMAFYISGESIETNASNAMAGSNILRASFSINDDQLFNSVYVVGGDKPIMDGSRFGATGGSLLITDSVTASGTFVPGYPNTIRFDFFTNPATSGIGIQLQLQRQSGTSPDGENIGYKTIESDGISSSGWTSIEFDQRVILTSGNTYWWLLSANGTGSVYLFTSGGTTQDKIMYKEYYGKSIIANKIDWSSIRAYTNGVPKEKVIVDRRIRNQDTAESKANMFLKQHSVPKYEGRIEIIGDPTIRAGRYTSVVIPQHGINESFVTKEVTHTFGENGFRTQIVCDAEAQDLAFKMQDHEERLKALESISIDTSVNLTKFFNFLDAFSFKLSGDSLVRYEITDLGSSFILGHPTRGLLGSGNTPQSYLGDSRSPWEEI